MKIIPFVSGWQCSQDLQVTSLIYNMATRAINNKKTAFQLNFLIILCILNNKTHFKDSIHKIKISCTASRQHKYSFLINKKKVVNPKFTNIILSAGFRSQTDIDFSATATLICSRDVHECSLHLLLIFNLYSL